MKKKTEIIADAQAQGKTDAEVAELINKLEETGLASDLATADLKDKAAQRMLSDFDHNIESGFQAAAQRGPLCAEPVQGMAYIVEKVQIGGEDQDLDSG